MSDPIGVPIPKPVRAMPGWSMACLRTRGMHEVQHYREHRHDDDAVRRAEHQVPARSLTDRGDADGVEQAGVGNAESGRGHEMDAQAGRVHRRVVRGRGEHCAEDLEEVHARHPDGSAHRDDGQEGHAAQEPGDRAGAGVEVSGE